MSVTIEADVIRLAGRCGAEDAEPLLTALAAGCGTVDVTGCEHLHAAILQLLMATRPTIVGEAGSFLARWILPAIDPAQDSAVGASRI